MATGVDILLGVLIAGAGFQGSLKVTQGGAFLIQIVIGRSHPVIPAVILTQFLLVGLEQIQGFLVEGMSCRSDFGNRNVGLGQFTVQFRCALSGGEGFQGVNDLLNFILFEPQLALFQQFHTKFSFSASPFSDSGLTFWQTD